MKEKLLVIIGFLFITQSYSQVEVDLYGKRHQLVGKLICTYVQGEDTNKVYLEVKNDSIYHTQLIRKNGIYTTGIFHIAAINQIDFTLSRILEIGLNETIHNAGMLQLTVKDYKESILCRLVESNTDSTFHAMSMNMVTPNLSEANYLRWKISTTVKTPIPDQKVLVRYTTYMVPAVPTFYSNDKDDKGKNNSYHRFYNIKNDSLYIYTVNELDEYSSKCGYITIEKAPLSQISKKNMVVRQPDNTEFSTGPEKDSWMVVIGSPGKFIVTDWYHTGNYTSETQKAFMHIVCNNKEMATAICNEILKAAR